MYHCGDSGGGGIIPRPVDGVEDEEICAKDWERRRAAEIISGKGRPNSIGGRKIVGHNLQKAH